MDISATHSNTHSFNSSALWESSNTQVDPNSITLQRAKRGVDENSDLTRRVVASRTQSISSLDTCMQQKAIDALERRIRQINNIGNDLLFSPREAQIIKRESKPLISFIENAIIELRCASTQEQRTQILNTLSARLIPVVDTFEKALLLPMVSKLKSQIDAVEIGLREALQNIRKASTNSSGEQALSDINKAELRNIIQSSITALEIFEIGTSLELLDADSISKSRLVYDKCKQILSELLSKIMGSRSVKQAGETVVEHRQKLRTAYNELGLLGRLRNEQMSFLEDLIWGTTGSAVLASLIGCRRS